jgi:hypothetical protein
MKTNNDLELVEIFSGTILEVEIIRSLLENAEIETFMKDEITGTLLPWITASGGFCPVKLEVSNLDYDKAKQIIEEYNQNKSFL